MNSSQPTHSDLQQGALKQDDKMDITPGENAGDGPLAKETSPDPVLTSTTSDVIQAADEKHPEKPPHRWKLSMVGRDSKPESHRVIRDERDSTNRQMRDHLARLTEEVAHLKRERDEERQERQRRDADVESMRHYAMANDASQGSDAVDLIQQINNSVSTFAVELSLNWSIPKEKGPYRVTRELRCLSSALAQCHPDNSQAPVLLQIAIQSSILHVVSYIMEESCYGMDETLRRSVQALEKRVQESESQATFGRWRVLTYNALFTTAAHGQQQLVDKHLPRIVEDLQYYGALLTGHKLNQDDYNELARDTRQIVEEVISKSIQFSYMVRTKIVSANYRHYMPIKYKPYNEEKMEILHPLTKPIPGKDRVAAIVRLGLFRDEKVGREGFGDTKVIKSKPLKAEIFTEAEVFAKVNESTSSHLLSQDTHLPDGPPNDLEGIHHDHQADCGPNDVRDVRHPAIQSRHHASSRPENVDQNV